MDVRYPSIPAPADPLIDQLQRALHTGEVPSEAGLPPTISVERAGALVGVGRNAAYRAAAAGEIPVIRIGRRLRVPTAQLLRMLGIIASGPGAAA